MSNLYLLIAVVAFMSSILYVMKIISDDADKKEE